MCQVEPKLLAGKKQSYFSVLFFCFFQHAMNIQAVFVCLAFLFKIIINRDSSTLLKCPQWQLQKIYVNSSVTSIGTLSGLFYKHITIVSYDSSTANKLGASPTDDARVIIYDRHMFIVQATGDGTQTVLLLFVYFTQSSQGNEVLSPTKQLFVTRNLWLILLSKI